MPGLLITGGYRKAGRNYMYLQFKKWVLGEFQTGGIKDGDTNWDPNIRRCSNSGEFQTGGIKDGDRFSYNITKNNILFLGEFQTGGIKDGDCLQLLPLRNGMQEGEFQTGGIKDGDFSFQRIQCFGYITKGEFQTGGIKDGDTYGIDVKFPNMSCENFRLDE